jgi:thioredoxin-related protein
MARLYIPLLILLLSSFSGWQNNLTTALSEAATEKKYVLLNFSGSDWCGPCKMMEKNIFESKTFSDFADSTLILVNADFPRNKKNQLPDKQQDLNNAMADKYNSRGIFPLTILLDSNGKILISWEGCPKIKPEEFIAQIKPLLLGN